MTKERAKQLLALISEHDGNIPLAYYQEEYFGKYNTYFHHFNGFTINEAKEMSSQITSSQTLIDVLKEIANKQESSSIICNSDRQKETSQMESKSLTGEFFELPDKNINLYKPIDPHEFRKPLEFKDDIPKWVVELFQRHWGEAPRLSMGLNGQHIEYICDTTSNKQTFAHSGDVLYRNEDGEIFVHVKIS